MPKISKARIVNFNYNDGNRLIADELYDFSNHKNNDALNVLINLANGGGKSVLVQLLMQPVIPKAKVAGRKLESFFNKLSDHCYVVLEWLKDGSSEKLLTGISIGAREVMSSEDDSLGSMGIKYYTFCANYASDASECSLVNLPLSRMENGRFIPAEYDDIKKFAKRSRSDLACYTSDDNPRWQHKLSQYGLIQDEWRMMEKLNSEEGGLGKYFGEFKTSDQLVDRLLIPTIETKLTSSADIENSSLSTMLISYARQYAGQKNRLHEMETYKKFQDELNELKPIAEQLWELYDKQGSSEASLFGLSVSMQKQNKVLKSSQEQIKAQLEELNKQLEHIRWEEISSEYYISKNACQKADEELQYARLEEDRFSEELDSTVHNISVLECADYYRKLRKCRNLIDALKKNILQKESGSDGGDEINILGYSAACAIREELNLVTPKLDSCKAAQKHGEQQLNEQKATVSELKSTCAGLKTEFNQLSGKLEGAVEETDKEVQSLNRGIMRRIDGAYSAEEFDRLEQQQKELYAEKEGELQKAETRIEEIQSRAEQIPLEISNFSNRISHYENQIERINEILGKYDSQEKEIKSICDEHNLNFSLRFTSYISDYLTSALSRNEAAHSDVLRRHALCEEEIKAAKEGYLHVPKGIIDYINSTGVPYTTCEKYLLDLVDTNKLSENECLSILKNYPAAAYGILMEEKNIEKFFSYGREKWLPAMVPVFTYEQIDSILNKEADFSGAIAFYSVDYFADKSHYISKLSSKAHELRQKTELLEVEKAHLQQQMAVVSNFGYEENWRPEREFELERLTQAIKNFNQDIGKLKQQKDQLLNEKNRQLSNIKEYKAATHAAEALLRTVNNVRLRISRELEIETLINAKKTELLAAEGKYKQQNELLDSYIKENDDALKTISDLTALHEHLVSALPAVEDIQAEKRVQGDWADLYEQYLSSVRTADTEIKNLREQLRSQTELASSYRNEIERRELSQEDYIDEVYSDEAYKQLVSKRKELEGSLSRANQATKSAMANFGTRKGRLERVEEQLAQFGKALEKAEVGTDFDSRRSRITNRQKEYISQRESFAEQERNLDKELNRLENYLSGAVCPEQIPEIVLEEDYVNQRIRLTELHLQYKTQLNEAENHINAKLNLMAADFSDCLYEIKNAVGNMQSLLDNKGRGDRFYTLTLFIEQYINNTALAISKISLDLDEFNNFRGDLIKQCSLQGKQIYDGLQQMASSSRVTVYDGRPKQRMIQFDFPDQIDSMVAEASIADEIDRGTKELVSKLSDESVTEAELRKLADRIVGSRSLLRKYIGRDSIGVSAYKIDRNPENSGYRKWKDTQINNSGAEKFVVYFAVILSLMNYTRGGAGIINEKERHSVLILDNPFGATSSRHILVPMFAIATHFRVQMICLSDINKTDVINCFDIVIKAVVKKRPMSNHELLTHEGNELIEHGFYRSEQLSI